MFVPFPEGNEENEHVFFVSNFKRVNIFFEHSYPNYKLHSDLNIAISPDEVPDFSIECTRQHLPSKMEMLVNLIVSNLALLSCLII
jgi:hypothetical protein